MNPPYHRVHAHKETFCQVPLSVFAQKREEYAVNLRKSRRNEHVLQRRHHDEAEDCSAVYEAYPDFTSLSPGQKLQALVNMLGTSQCSRTLVHTLISLRSLVHTGLVFSSILDLNVLMTLKTLLETVDEEKVKGYVLWVLASLTDSSECIEVLKSQEFLSLLLQHLHTSNPFIARHTLWVLANICGESESYCNKLLAQGVPDTLWQLTQYFSLEPNTELLAIISWLLSNLAKGSTNVNLPTCECMIAIVKLLLREQDEEVVAFALYTLKYATADSPKNLNAVVNAGLTPVFLEFLSSPHYRIQQAAVTIFCNYTYHNAAYTFLELNVLDKLVPALTSGTSAIRHEALFALSNLAAGTPRERKALVNHEVFQLCLRALTDSFVNCRIEGSYILSNICKLGDNDEILHLLQFPILTKIKESLAGADQRILLNLLEVMTALFEAKEAQGQLHEFAIEFDNTECLTETEKLMNHNNSTISLAAQQFIQKFFGFEEEDHLN